MSQFMNDANRVVNDLVVKLGNYGTAYAMARAQGKTPWEASSGCSAFERGIQHEVLQEVRRRIDRLVEERDEARDIRSA